MAIYPRIAPSNVWTRDQIDKANVWHNNYFIVQLNAAQNKLKFQFVPCQPLHFARQQP